jgi:two-component system response regulator AtoC
MEERVQILLVDDEPHFCNVMAMHLGDEGYEVVMATEVREALEHFVKEDVHLVITDLRMPGMDGLSLLEGIRDLSVDVPVIVLTAFGTVDTAVQAMKLGAFDYILKPVDVDELKMVVARALRLQEIAKENLVPLISKAAEVDSHVLIRGRQERVRNWWPERYTPVVARGMPPL